MFAKNGKQASCDSIKKLLGHDTWHRVKPSIKHFKIFRCVHYAFVPKVKRDKLNQRAKIGIFIGYDSNSKGYIVYTI